eukprot:scaffold7056_cov144-Skeletonema_marinoi.AAC.4
MDIDRPSVEERNQRYKPGSIKRVKLKNFLTYDDVEFFPGPRCTDIFADMHHPGIAAHTLS